MKQRIMLLTLLLVTVAETSRAQAPAADEATVTAWIDQLPALEAFDTGLSPTYSGLDFPPVDGQLEWGVATLSEHAVHRRNDALRRLVATGPQALPGLLAHLDDKRETKLKVEHKTGFGGMWYATEVPAPRPNKREVAALKIDGLNKESDGMPESIASHAVTVGDVCFVIIGMIVNRPYNAVRYQPTACIVINSPTTSPAIAKALRTMWGERPTANDLKAWLDEDFAAGFHGAATRLLYYFPADSNTRVLARLERLTKSNDDSLQELVHATAWCEDPSIRAWIRTTAMRAKDPNLVQASMPAFAEPGNAQRREELDKLLVQWKSRGEEPLESILTTTLSSHPEHAAKVLESALRDSNHAARLACVRACGGMVTPPVVPLRRLLDDVSDGSGHYLIEGKDVREKPEASDFLQHRICDNVYVLISRALGDKKVTCIGDRATMNRQIAELKQRLKGEESGWPFTADDLTAREEQRTARAREIHQRLERLKTSAQTPAEGDILVLEDPRLTAEQWRDAAARLFDEPKADKPSLANVVANRRMKRARVFETLSVDDRGRVRAALEMQARSILSTTSGSWPHEDCAAYFALAEQCGPVPTTPLRQSMLERLVDLTKQRGLPHQSEEWSTALLVMDTLLDTGTPRAAELFARWCEVAKPADLNNGFSLREFMELLVRHHEMAPVQAAAERMFTRKGMPWNPGIINYSMASDFGSAGLLQVPAFRKALLGALDREDVTGELTMRKGETDYCWIDWKRSTSGQGVGENEPRGVKPGGPAMKIRRCDMLLEAVANAVFSKDDGPVFHIYWPLARRDEGRAAWRQWLAQPTDKRN